MAADEQAARLGHRLARLIRALDPDPTAAPLVTIPIVSADGAFRWEVSLSEAGMVGLTALLEAVEERQWTAGRPALRLVSNP